MTKEEDRHAVNSIASNLCKWCYDEKVPITVFNIVIAFYDLHYGDWLGGDDIYPMCEPEKGAIQKLSHFVKRLFGRKSA